MLVELIKTTFFLTIVIIKLDGHIARKYNMKTLLGTIIDPLADKVLMTVMTVTLAMEGTLPGTYI